MRRPDPAQRAPRNGRGCLSGDAEGLRTRQSEPPALEAVPVWHPPARCPAAGFRRLGSNDHPRVECTADQRLKRRPSPRPAEDPSTAGPGHPGAATAIALRFPGWRRRRWPPQQAAAAGTSGSGTAAAAFAGWPDWAYGHQQEHRARAQAGSRLRLLWTSVAPCARSQPRCHMTAHPRQQALSAVGDERNAQQRRASPAPPHRSQRRSGARIASRGAWPCCGAAAMPCARWAPRPCPATLVIPALSRGDAAHPPQHPTHRPGHVSVMSLRGELARSGTSVPRYVIRPLGRARCPGDLAGREPAHTHGNR